MKKTLLVSCTFLLCVNAIFCQSYKTGQYRNFFLDNGHSQTEINLKIQQMINHYFNGNNTQKVYYDFDSDEAYIKDIANNDIRSEQQAYGMMICVQLNKKTEFDKLWKFAKTRMQHSGGSYDGYFRWHVNLSGNPFANDEAMTPDAEAYIISALFFADQRWRSGSGILNYRNEASGILTKIMNKGWTGPVTNMFGSPDSIICFQAITGRNTFTSTAYNLPGFFAMWADVTGDNKWLNYATQSRYIFQDVADDSTGLMADYTNSYGVPYGPDWNPDAKYYMYDAQRAIMNMAFDYQMFDDSTYLLIAERNICTNLQNFFKSKGMTTYDPHYYLDGTPYKPEILQSKTQIACNAVGSLASISPYADEFVEALWNMPLITGQNRSFDGMMHMMAMLHCSGMFKGNWKLVNKIIAKPFVVNLNQGSTTQAFVTIYPEDAAIRTVTWTSTNTSVATVSSTGLITAVGEGITNIRAKTTDGTNLISEIAVYVNRPTSYNVTIRAMGSSGSEHINLLIDGKPVNAGYTLTQSVQSYTAAVSSKGAVSVEFTNSAENRFVSLDYIVVSNAKRETEDIKVNGAAKDGSLCGKGQFTNTLSCNGSVVFGDIVGGTNTHTIRFRAYGERGDEHVDLLFNGTPIGGGFYISKSYQEYSATVTGEGNIRFEYDNDNSSRTAFIDWLKVDDQSQRQAEDMSVNTAAYANGKCGGGSYTERMACNGYIDFGYISSVPTALKTTEPMQANEKTENSLSSVSIYPNPSNGMVTIDFGDSESNTSISICDLSGRIMYSASGVSSQMVEVTGLKTGLYIVNINNKRGTYNQKLIVQ